MPEGHTIHRAARLQRRRFAGCIVRARSPQGRFAAGAARLDGERLCTVEAHGKHLFHRYGSGDVLHIHLGLFGRLRIRTPPFPEPSPNARLVLSTDDAELHLSGPNVCEVIDDDTMSGLVARLGPDPLGRADDPVATIAASLARRRVAVGKALMDQRVIAGIGNVYRSELLFLAGIDPFTPAHRVTTPQIESLWAHAVEQLRAGERSGRIITVDPADVGETSRSALKGARRLYCYKRAGRICRRCDDEIQVAAIDQRKVWWCPTHQPPLLTRGV